MTNPDTGPRSGHGLDERLVSARSTIAELGGSAEHRREELVDQAEDHGLGRKTAEEAYDLATEEELAPAYAIALVLEGISVRLLDGARPDVEASEPNEPEWVDSPPRPGHAQRERRLRQTFRRLRSHVSDTGDPAAGFEAFARDPDLEPYDY